jgi:FtsP/CotA-like multicopper oxidase with cupredoxin domain
VLPLLRRAADSLKFTFTNPGPWLFRCHVVNHGGSGMICIINIEPTKQ